jgi:DivIVA domain-containing protein
MDPAQRPVFTRTRYRLGYATAQVDAFVDKIEATLGRQPRAGPPVTADDVDRVRFRLVRLRAGYDMREVDDALDRYIEQLRQLGHS